MPDKLFRGDINNSVVELNLLDEESISFGTSSYGIGTLNNGEIKVIINGDINSSAFYDAGSSLAGNDMKGLVIGTSCTSISSYAFYYCDGLQGSLVIPDSVTTIGNASFGACGFNGNLIIPDSVTSIGDFAFIAMFNANGYLMIGSGVTSIGSVAFSNLACTNAYIDCPASSWTDVDSLTNVAFSTMHVKDAVARGYTLGSQTFQSKLLTIVEWNNYPNPVPN